MVVHEYGDRKKPVIMLFPGTGCYWKANFGEVLEGLQKHFLVAAVSYSGFDEAEKTEFTSMLEETQQIEAYIKAHYGGKIHTAYGCSLGGTFVGLLIARKQVHMEHGIIGSSDMDQAAPFMAAPQSKMVAHFMYPLITTGHFKSRLLDYCMKKTIARMGDYGEKLLAMFGVGKYELGFVTKRSIENQFYSDLITVLPEKISAPGTTVHVFFALKMGKKYRARYEKYFHNPDIITLDMQHEELLAAYPKEWIALVEKTGGM